MFREIHEASLGPQYAVAWNDGEVIAGFATLADARAFAVEEEAHRVLRIMIEEVDR